MRRFLQDGTDQFIGAIRKAEVERDRGLLYMAIDGTILCASKGFTSILGWESNELFGQALHNLSHEGVQLAKALTTIQDAAATGTQGAAQPPNGPGTPGGALLERKRSSVGGGVGTKSPLKQPGRVSVQDKPTADAKDREMAPLTRGASQRFQEQLAEQSGGGQRCVLVQGVASLMRHKYLKGGLECTADFAALLSSSRYDVFEVSFAAQSNPRALLVCATDGRLVHASTAAEDLLGYPRGSLLESSAVIGNLMPRGFGDFHTSRLQAVTGHRGVHVPCQMGQVVLLRGGQGAMVPVQLSWWLQRVEGSPSPVYVCSLKRVQREFALSAWGMRLTEGSVERQVCLRTLISPGGRMLSVGHGVGFSASNIPGAVYGVNALGMVGANLADHIDVLQGMIKAARRFNKNLSADEVMRSTLPQLARSCVQSTTAFRAGILCPLPDNQGEERVPVRLVVKPASDTRVSAPSLAKLGLWGCTEDELADAAKDGYVVDLWSANWLLGEVEVTGTGTVRGISPEMELLSGSQAKVVVGSPVHALFTEESGRSVAAVASGRQSSAEVSLRHVDGSAPRVTVLGPGTPVPRSQRRVVLLVRATGESVEAEMDMLHRIQVMVERDTPHSEILPIQHAVMRQLSKGVAGTASGRRSTVDEGPIVQARERRGSKVAFVELIDEGAPAPKDSSSAGATGAVEHSHGGKSELESKDGGSDSDSDFGGGVGGGADNADDAVSQGVGRTHFRRSKHYKKIFELFRKSRLVQKLSMLLPSILTILSAGILLHVVLFAVMATLVQANKYKISRASTAGDIYIATARLPLQARRLQNAAAGGLWGVDLSIDMLRDDMGNILDDLIAQARSNYTGRGNKSAALVERLQRGVQYTFLLDKDLGDGEGAREVTPGPTEEGGLLRLTELLMSNAEYVRRAPQELLARSPSDSREWRFTVEGPQETFLPMQSLLLGVSYDRAGADVTSLQRNVLVLGLVQALVVMPLCTLVALLRTRALLAEKARVFTVFLSVPRAVAFRLATGRGTETASASMRGRAPLDLVTTLTEEERRAVRKLDRPAGRTMRKLLRFMEPIRQLRNDTWRLQVKAAR